MARPTRPRPHVAIVLDGNGRWAEARGLARSEGYRAGVEAVRRVVEVAPALGIGTLSLYALSSDNWQRPAGDLDEILRLVTQYALHDARQLAASGARLTFPGRRDRLPGSLVAAMADAERRTAAGRSIWIRIAVDYSARDIAARAASRGAEASLDREAFRARLAEAAGEAHTAPDVDLFIRPGGERRMSDFLLLESAYAELEFLDQAWPDVTPADIEACLRRFESRDRRFGALPARRLRITPLERTSTR